MPGGTAQTLDAFLWRAARLYPDTEIVSRTVSETQRYGYGSYADRVGQLANALVDAGYDDCERIGTVCWNHHRHFEAYFGVPRAGAQLHTINPLLPDEHLQHIVSDAADRLLFVDPSLVETVADAYADDPDAFDSVERFVLTGETIPETPLDPVVTYDSFVEGYDAAFERPRYDGDRPAGLCYTSGTTGRPKGVEYTHRMLWSHTMGMLSPQGIPMADDDVVCPVVPMFHVNAWGLPFTATAAGAKHVYPGPRPDPADIAALIEREGVTITAGVPTVWLGLMEYVEDNAVDLSTLETVVIGGSAAPESMIRFFDERDVSVLHAWGMTETTPLGAAAHLKADLADADYETRVEKRSKQGLVLPGLEFRVVDDDGDAVPWDGETLGELQIRGPWVTTEYVDGAEDEPVEEADEAFVDGYLKTGDVVSVDEDGYIELVDRAADIIKSGGEWISSVELENELLAHDAVSEAAVIGVPHDRWGERPLALVVLEGDALDEPEKRLRSHLAESYPEWWLPDAVRAVSELPKTATGKYDKQALRESYDDESLVAGRAPEADAPEETGE